MKNLHISIRSIALIILIGPSKLTLAHEKSGALQSSPYSTQRWLINCFDDGNGRVSHVYFVVKARTPGRTFGVKATLSKNGLEASTIDLKSVDRIRSPATKLSAGDGDYLMTISKVKSKASEADTTLKGTMAFGFTYHCESVSGAHTGTLINRR